MVDVSGDLTQCCFCTPSLVRPVISRETHQYDRQVYSWLLCTENEECNWNKRTRPNDTSVRTWRLRSDNLPRKLRQDEYRPFCSVFADIVSTSPLSSSQTNQSYQALKVWFPKSASRSVSNQHTLFLLLSSPFPGLHPWSMSQARLPDRISWTLWPWN